MFLAAAVVSLSGFNASAADEWQPAGHALFMDGWLHPGLSLDQHTEAFQYEVPLEKNTVREGVYRLVDPYHLGAPALYNDATEPGYIVFDVSDPDHVVFEATNAGFINYYPMGITEFYCTNNAGYVMSRRGWDLKTLIQNVGDDFTWTTFKNGVVTLGSMTNKNGETEWDACFGTQNSFPGQNAWFDRDGFPVNMDASITFLTEAGIDNVIEKKDDGRPRYFNLQGVEVKNPEKGVYIEMKNGKSRKVIF